MTNKMLQLAGFAVAVVLLLTGCGGQSEVMESPQAAPAASNYQLTCQVNGEDLTVTDYHEIWSKGTSDDCLGGDGKQVAYEVAEPFTDVQIAAITLARSGESGADESGGTILAYTYPSCGETKAGSRLDPAKWSAADMPNPSWRQRVVDLQVTMTLCPDHPWATDWKSRIASRVVVSASR